MDLGDIELLATIPPDTQQLENDVRGQSVFDLPADSVLLRGVERALHEMAIL